MTADQILAVFLIGIAIETFAEMGLLSLNLASLHRNGSNVPDHLTNSVDLPTYKKAIEYSTVRCRFEMLLHFYSAGFLVLFVLCGGFKSAERLVGPLPDPWRGITFVIG